MAITSAQMAAPRALMEIEASAAALAGQQMALSASAIQGDVMAGLMGARAEALAYRGGAFRTQAPAPSQPGDPADSLYRAARKALSNESYREAANGFRRIRELYPKSTYTPDAPYWEAFALHRMGNEQDLREAQEALALQQRLYPKASTRGDASALSTRIEGSWRAAAIRRPSRVSPTGPATPPATDARARRMTNASTRSTRCRRWTPSRRMPILKKVLARREPCTQRLRRRRCGWSRRAGSRRRRKSC